jgi:hypothetical protein
MRRIPRGDWLEVGAVVAISAIAVFLRYYQIGQVPPGLNSDEAVGAVGAAETLRSGLRLYYAGQGGGGALGFYIAALAFALFGASVETLRGTTAFAGVVSVVGSYFVTRELFRPGGPPDSQKPDLTAFTGRVLAGVTALLLAVSLWHAQSSRVAFAAIGVPFLQVPGNYFLWRGMHTGRRVPFVVSGVFLAACMYIYMSGSFAPLVYLLFFLLQWGIAGMSRRFGEPGAGAIHPGPLAQARAGELPLLKRHFRNLVVCALVAFVLVLPLLYFYLSAPELATQRAQQALFTNPRINQGDLWGTLWRSVRGNLAAFGFSASWLSGQPPANLIWPVAVAGLFLLGCAVSLWRAGRGRPAYLFTLVSWAVMIVPSILSPDMIPHTLRAVGAAPAAYTLAAIGALALTQGTGRLAGYIWRRSVASVRGGRGVNETLPQPTALHYGAPALVGGLLALAVAHPLYASWYEYMVVWPRTNDARAAYHQYAVSLAHQMSHENNPQATFLLPRDTAAGDVNPNYTVMFLYHGQAGYAWIVDDETSLEGDLNQAVAGRQVVHVVRWKTSKHTGADPKDIIPYYLEKHGHHVQTRRFEDFDIETYQLDQPGPDLRDPPLTPASLDFGGVVRLTGYVFGDASGTGPVDAAGVPAGQLVWVRLRLQLLQTAQENLKAAIIIADPAGHPAGQVDKLVLNNILHQGTSTWAAGSQADVYFLVPVAPASPPGDYRLGVAVYGASNQVRLAPATDLSAGGVIKPLVRLAPLGRLVVRPDVTPPAGGQLGLTGQLDLPVAPGLTLMGYAAGQPTLRPGQQAALALVWRADARPEADYRAGLWAVQDGGGLPQPDGGWQLSAWLPLAGMDYPSSRWAAGQLVRGWFDVRLPPDIAGGTYQLRLRLGKTVEQSVTDISLGTLRVEGWPRRFDVPAMQVSRPANFGDQLELLGYDLILPGQAGPDLQVVLYWRALRQPARDYTTFVHILNGSGQLATQQDHVPGGGAFPTGAWLPGEVIADRFSLLLPAGKGLDPATAQLELGVYDPATGDRLPVLDAAGQGVDNRVLVSGR